MNKRTPGGLILPPSGLAVPKSAAPEPVEAVPPLDMGAIKELTEQAGRGLFAAMQMIERGEDPLAVATALADVQAFVAEATRTAISMVVD